MKLTFLVLGYRGMAGLWMTETECKSLLPPLLPQAFICRFRDLAGKEEMLSAEA